MCSEEILAEARKCKHCGTRLDRAELAQQARQVVLSRTGAAVGVLLAVLVLIVLSYTQRSKIVLWELQRQMRGGIEEGHQICLGAVASVLGEEGPAICAIARADALSVLHEAARNRSWNYGGPDSLKQRFTRVLSDPTWARRAEAWTEGRGALWAALGASWDIYRPARIEGFDDKVIARARTAMLRAVREKEDASPAR